MRWGRRHYHRESYLTRVRARNKRRMRKKLIPGYGVHRKYDLNQWSRRVHQRYYRRVTYPSLNERFRRWTEGYNPYPHRRKYRATYTNQPSRASLQSLRASEKSEAASESASQRAESASHSSAIASIYQEAHLENAITDFSLDATYPEHFDLKKDASKISSAVANDSNISDSKSTSISTYTSSVMSIATSSVTRNHRKASTVESAFSSLRAVVSSASSCASADVNYSTLSAGLKLTAVPYYIPEKLVNQLRNKLNATKSSQASRVDSETKSALSSLKPESTHQWYSAYQIASSNASVQMRDENYLKSSHPKVSSAVSLRDYYASCNNGYNKLHYINGRWTSRRLK